jgi:MOSC domain-containing protein YiiM
MARIVAINLSERKGVPKQAVPVGRLITDWGFADDAHAGSWHRQVSLLGVESIRKIEALGIQGLCTGRFAENVTTEGIVLYDLPVGSRLQLGSCLLEVTQIGKECHRHCAIYHQVGDCVMPREGIFARVICGGMVKAGDPIEVATRPEKTELS